MVFLTLGTFANLDKHDVVMILGDGFIAHVFLDMDRIDGTGNIPMEENVGTVAEIDIFRHNESIVHCLCGKGQ